MTIGVCIEDVAEPCTVNFWAFSTSLFASSHNGILQFEVRLQLQFFRQVHIKQSDIEAISNHLIPKFAVLAMLSECVECGDKRIDCFSLWLQQLIESWALVSWITSLNKVFSESILESVVAHSLVLTQSKASENIFYLFSH